MGQAFYLWDWDSTISMQWFFYKSIISKLRFRHTFLSVKEALRFMRSRGRRLAPKIDHTCQYMVLRRILTLGRTVVIR